MYLVKYVKNKKGEKIGVLVAVAKNRVGWAACNKLDKFNKELGLSIAMGRAHNPNFNYDSDNKQMSGNDVIPMFIFDEMDDMYERSVKYFKDDFYQTKFNAVESKDTEPF